MNKVELFVNGKIFGGWNSVSIKKSIKNLSSTFDLGVTDNWSNQRIPWILAPGDECELKIDSVKLITGYIDSIDNSISAASKTISVSGRDKTADFIDCSYAGAEFKNKNISVAALARKLAAPFKLTVVKNQYGLEVVKNLTISQGETCFEILDKASKQFGYLFTSNENSEIIITRPSTLKSTTNIEQGVNLVSGSATFDFSNRFSEYTVKSQSNDFANEPELASVVANFQIKQSAKDESLKRYRPFMFVSESIANAGQARSRAQWEAKKRAADASKFKVTVKGWKKADGTLWIPNELVRLKSVSLGIDDDLLITSIEYNQSNSGTFANMELERKDAYLPEPVVKEKGDPFASQITKELAGR
ncbi:MAG: Phage late control gene D protein (GPD) [bacterium ADurb.Bin212]|nr:MAG: Phage late control gene D protein (GPD) [bacterium ADurb.Bin212]